MTLEVGERIGYPRRDNGHRMEMTKWLLLALNFSELPRNNDRYLPNVRGMLTLNSFLL